MPLGGSNVPGAYRTFVLEIHYDNADHVPDQVDSSGVRVYHVPEPREHLAGVYAVGDPALSLRGQAIPPGVSDYLFRCGGSCSSLYLGDGQPVTVIREHLHMHQSGYAMYNEHVRDGQVIRTGAVDYYEFSQSGGPAVQQPQFEIYPGDSFNVRCYYKNDEDSNRTFGIGSAQEMCMAFLVYYPRKVLSIAQGLAFPWYCSLGLAEFGFEPCDAPVTTGVLDGGQAPEWRTFGQPSTECAASNDSETTPGPGASSPVTSSSGAARRSSRRRFATATALAAAVGAVAAIRVL
jgi:hypothetical protein